MKIALGFKSHSGWAALVAVGEQSGEFSIEERCRVELVDEGASSAKQPYHAAEDLEPVEGHEVVKQGIESARRLAKRRLKEILHRYAAHGHKIAACAVVTPEPMPDWSADEILAVHFRMHKAEGVLFPDALCRAVKAEGIALVAVPEKQIEEIAQRSFGGPMDAEIKELGRSVGPPWGKDQKLAALAAMIALRSKKKL